MPYLPLRSPSMHESKVDWFAIHAVETPKGLNAGPELMHAFAGDKLLEVGGTGRDERPKVRLIPAG